MYQMKKQQEAEMMEKLRQHFATRDEPKVHEPVENSLADLHRGMAQHTARENAKRMEELAAAFAKRNAQRAAKSK